MLWSVNWSLVNWWLAPLIFLGIRPLAVSVGLAGGSTQPIQRRLIAWFGVRGIGSLYYLGYAMNHGLAPALVSTLVVLTLTTVVASIIAHGISVTRLMNRYEKMRGSRRTN